MAVRFVKLHCINCESDTCTKVPMGAYITETQGCEKQVSNLDGDKYFYYRIEVRPLLRKLGMKANPYLWKEYTDFMQYIADLPAGERFKK